MASPTDTPPFEVVKDWEQLPDGMVHLDVCDVAVDVEDNVFLLARKNPAVIVYDSAGRFLRTWGADVFSERPHGITLAPDGSVYVVDEGNQVVLHFSSAGEQLGVIGTAGARSDTGIDESISDLHGRLQSITHGGGPFNRPTKVAVAPSGDLYVSDGYGNARVHQFTSGGELIRSWGEPGNGPGEFNLPHCVSVLADGRVIVSDRENDRIQVFTPGGTYLEEWPVQRPNATSVYRDGLIYVLEGGLWRGDFSFAHGTVEVDLPPRVCILDENGTVLERWTNVGDDPCAPGNLVAAHGLCIDSRQNIYIAEVTHTSRTRRGHAADNCHTFQKFSRKQSSLSVTAGTGE